MNIMGVNDPPEVVFDEAFFGQVAQNQKIKVSERNGTERSGAERAKN